MKKTWLILFSYLCLIPSFSFANASIDLIRANEKEVIVKVTTSHFTRETKRLNDSTYYSLTADGLGRTSKIGSPELPFRGMLVGIPSQSKVKAELIREKVEEITGIAIYPCPKKEVEERNGEISLKEVFYRDEEAYARDAYFPGRAIEVSLIGDMRGQKVAKVDIYPFQYNPAQRKLKVYREMIIRVSFEGGKITPDAFSREEIPYEEMLKKLLVNYDSLGRHEREGVKRIEAAPQQGASGGIPDLKIHLTGEGMYKVTYANLSSLWTLETIDPSKIHLKHLGVEIPILFQGETNRRFDPSDYFLFYAPPLQSDFTKDDVYWLSVDSTNGLRMDSLDGTVGNGDPLNFFNNTYHGEEEHVYWENVPNGEGKDHWFWNKLPAPAEVPITFTLNNVMKGCSVCHDTLTFSFRGNTDDPVDPDHHTQILLNGHMVSDDKWNGQIEFTKTVNFNPSFVNEGTNTITVKSVGDTGASTDTVYFNWFDLIYPRTYMVEGDYLKFKGEGSGNCIMEITGFTTSDMYVFDITQPTNPEMVVNTPCYSCHAIKFQDTISGSKDYVALTPSSAKVPTSIQADVPSSLKDTANGADYIIITHEDFYDAILPLANYRASQEKRVMVVKVGDVYDEFSYGLFDPQAIRDFLKYAYENYQTPAPLYCLLVGDADMDYFDNFGTGRKNYCPTHLCQTTGLGDTPTDNWFACVSGNDVLPDMYIGRISVNTAAEVTAVVNKILNYEQAPAGSWNSEALFVADDDDSEFEGINDNLIGYLPESFESHKVYLGHYPSVDACKTDLMDNINQGKLITVYMGHGNYWNWTGNYTTTGELLFQTSDVAKLTNNGMPTFCVTLTCLNGFYAHPKVPYCLAEELLRQDDRGAVACFSPTGLGYTWEHDILGQELFEGIFNEKDYVIGSVVTSAKIESYTLHETTPDFVQIFTLFGDPATTLMVP